MTSSPVDRHEIHAAMELPYEAVALYWRVDLAGPICALSLGKLECLDPVIQFHKEFWDRSTPFRPVMGSTLVLERIF
jgi:hypothetical protein